VALKSLSMHPGLEDLELILPSDLIHERRSLWPVLSLVYKICATEVPQSDKSIRNSRVSTMVNTFKHRATRSQSPPPPPPPGSQGQTGRARDRRRTRSLTRGRSSSRSDPAAERSKSPSKGAVGSPAKHFRAKPSPGMYLPAPF
jgi:hypothetical protein